MKRKTRTFILILGGVVAVTFLLSDVAAARTRIDLEVPQPDIDALRLEDSLLRRGEGPMRFAVPHSVEIQAGQGGWKRRFSGEWIWTYTIRARGAVSINLGFENYHLPKGAKLEILNSSGRLAMRAFGQRDNAEHRELWTPIVKGEKLTLRLTVPKHLRSEVSLTLTRVNYGYRDLNTLSGKCNIDVVCSEGDSWRKEIASVGRISIEGTGTCTGFMVNNTAMDLKPYFLTAFHCEVRPRNAAKVVVHWNYQTSVCGGRPDGKLNHFQSGAKYVAGFEDSDFTLIELSSKPDPSWGVTYSGWNASRDEARTAVAIHHPNVDEKRISFEFQPTTTTSYFEDRGPGDRTHVRVADWDIGTTEPGSSGSPLYNEHHQAIGQLHGGWAACGNDEADWYGRISASWNGGGVAKRRLRDWLDPVHTGAIEMDTHDPNALALDDMAGAIPFLDRLGLEHFLSRLRGTFRVVSGR